MIKMRFLVCFDRCFFSFAFFGAVFSFVFSGFKRNVRAFYQFSVRCKGVNTVGQYAVGHGTVDGVFASDGNTVFADIIDGTVYLNDPCVKGMTVFIIDQFSVFVDKSVFHDNVLFDKLGFDLG